MKKLLPISAALIVMLVSFSSLDPLNADSKSDTGLEVAASSEGLSRQVVVLLHPIVESRIANAHLPANFRHTGARLGLTESKGDQLISELALLHAKIPSFDVSKILGEGQSALDHNTAWDRLRRGR
jgi:hypothetical protein